MQKQKRKQQIKVVTKTLQGFGGVTNVVLGTAVLRGAGLLAPATLPALGATAFSATAVVASAGFIGFGVYSIYKAIKH